MSGVSTRNKGKSDGAVDARGDLKRDGEAQFKDLRKQLDEADGNEDFPYSYGFTSGISSIEDLIARLCGQLPNKKFKTDGAFWGSDYWDKLRKYIKEAAPDMGPVHPRAFHFMKEPCLPAAPAAASPAPAAAAHAAAHAAAAAAHAADPFGCCEGRGDCHGSPS